MTKSEHYKLAKKHQNTVLTLEAQYKQTKDKKLLNRIEVHRQAMYNNFVAAK